MQLGLGSKFVIVVAGILSLTLSVISYFVFHTQSRLFQEHLNEKAQTLGRFVALISVEQVLSYDFFSLNTFVREVSAANDMAYAVVHDRKGNAITNYVDRENPIIAQTLREAKLDNIDQLAQHLAKDPQFINLSFPILFQGEAIGIVTVGASRARLQQTSSRLFIQQLAANAATIAFLSIAIYLAFRIAALRPISLLISGSQRIAAGNLDVPVGLQSNDELGRLAGSFDTMMNQLKQSIREKDDTMLQLQELNRTLEQRVQDRTLMLAASETRVRAVIEHVGEGIITIGTNHTIESMNPAGQQIFGCDNHSVFGRQLEDFLCETCRPHFNALVDAWSSATAPSDTRLSQPTTLEGRRATGEAIPIEIVVTPMDLPDKRVFVCIIRDITRRKETERQLADAQQKLLDSAHKAGMADIATSVLHNIGNILNSVQVSTDVITQTLRESKLNGLIKANALMTEHTTNLGHYISEDPKGKLLPQYYLKIGQTLEIEQERIREEMQALSDRTRMMREVIATQQSYARQGLFEEEKNLHELIDDALRVQLTSLINSNVQIKKSYADIPTVMTQKTKILQVMVNLLKNAKEAMDDNDAVNKPKLLTIATGRLNETMIFVDFIDNGCGIHPDNITRIFKHGFTTKVKGHGFGLHGSANAMTEMGGKLLVESDGPQCGARFRLTLRAAVAPPVTTPNRLDTQTITA